MPQNGLHGLVGLWAARASRRAVPSNLLPPFALGIVLGSMLPDVDMYPVGIATAFGAKFDIYAVHRTAAHSLLLILAVLAVGLCIPRRRPGRATALGLSLGFATHALLDIFFWFAPIDLFWPLHDVLPNVRFVDPINLWSAVHLPGWAISLRDSFEFGAFALYLLALRRVIRAVAVNDDGEAGLLRAEVILWALFLITLATSTVASTKLQQVLVFTPLLLFAMPYCWLQTWRYRREIGAWCANPAQKSVWTNWDDTLRDIPDQVRFPGSFDEVQEIVREARAAGKHVRVFGAGHSWSSLVPCKDILVSLDRLDKAEVKDPANRLVTVQAGIRLRDLGPWLREHGLALRNTGAVTAQSIAGAISTGTHGTGLGYGVMGTQLVEAKVVDGLGNLRTVTPANADELAAIRMSLGSLGIIVEATLECAKDHHVELTEIPMRFDDFVTNLNQLLKDNERVRAYWFPGSTRILVNTMNSKEKELGPGPVWPSSAVFSRSVLMGAMWRLGQCIHLQIGR